MASKDAGPGNQPRIAGLLATRPQAPLTAFPDFHSQGDSLYHHSNLPLFNLSVRAF